MSERGVRAASATLALAGAAICSYVLYVRAGGTSFVCSTGGCATVQASSYSKVLGVPVAALGLVGYALLLAAALSRGELARLAGASVSLSAAAFSAYLLYIQLHVIHALCDWCVASDVVTSALAVLALLRLYLAVRTELPPAGKPHRTPALH